MPSETVTLEDFRKARDKAQVAYQDFVLHTREFKDGLFCFFEGERGSDNAYYAPRIKQFTEIYHPIYCKGKDNVTKVHELIKNHKEYDKYKKAYFVDRDFDTPLPNYEPPIFETPCYSIENLYVSEDVFKEILKNTFHLSAISDGFKTCIALYKARLAEFHSTVLLFNSWYACLKDIRNATGKYTGVKLEEKFPKQFISFTIDSISATYDLNRLKEKYQDAVEIKAEYLNIKIDEFSKCEHHKIFRGKYELEFLLLLIELILKDSLHTKKYIKEEIKFVYNQKLSQEQALGIFSAYAETPESLLKYLQEVTT